MDKGKTISVMAIIIVVIVISAGLLYVYISNKGTSDSDGNSSATRVTSSPFLWRIDGDNPSYLYGSIHLAGEEVLTLPDVVMSAIDDADVVYTEIKFDSETQNEVALCTLLPYGQKLEDILTEDVASKLDSYLKTKGLTLSVFSQYKIWSVATTISILDEMENYLKNVQLDQYIWNTAVSKGKDVDGIETVQEQVDIFDTLSVEEQTQMLDDTITSLEEYAAKGESLIGVMLDAYLTGDLETLNNLMLSDFDETDPLDVKLKESLITNRNHNMANRISQLIENNSDKQFFFAVGAGHYWGGDGIVELLEDYGYNITRVEFNVCDSCGPGEINIDQRCYVPYQR